MQDSEGKASVGVYLDIAEERERQDEQWGGAAHDDAHESWEWRSFREKFETRAGNFRRPCNERRTALIKIAALAVAQIESIDRTLAEYAEQERAPQTQGGANAG